jgi:hypothetical protein
MPSNPTAPVRDRSKFAELKKKLLALPPAERVEQEVRLARENGLTVTAAQAAGISQPVERRLRADSEIVSAAPARVVRLAGDEGGQSVDLGSRVAMAEILKTSPFTQTFDPAALQAAIKTLAPSNAEEVLTRLDPQLEILSARGANAELLKAAKDAVASVLFSKVVVKPKTPVSGARND